MNSLHLFGLACSPLVLCAQLLTQVSIEYPTDPASTDCVRCRVEAAPVPYAVLTNATLHSRKLLTPNSRPVTATNAFKATSTKAH
jgi:hypothetical protein